jgi:hypothetical protein
MSSESFRQQMDSSSSAILLLYSPRMLYARGLTLIGVLPTLAEREGQWAMIICFNPLCSCVTSGLGLAGTAGSVWVNPRTIDVSWSTVRPELVLKMISV